MAAYGTQEQVAALASTWTDDGAWTDESNPTIDEVESWLELVSAQFNIALGSHFFVFPINSVVSPNAYLSAVQYVTSLVADLCNFKNSSGRFFTEKAVERGVTPMGAILRDMNNWIEMNSDGLVADNVPQISQPSIRKRPEFRVLG